MSEATKTADAPQTFEEMMRDWQNTAMANWGAVTRQMVGADSFFNLMSASMDLYLSSLKQMRSQMGTTLQLFEVPQMTDLARVSHQVLTAETRVVECEEQLDQARRELTSMQERMRELEALVAEMRTQRGAAVPSQHVATPSQDENVHHEDGSVGDSEHPHRKKGHK